MSSDSKARLYIIIRDIRREKNTDIFRLDGHFRDIRVRAGIAVGGDAITNYSHGFPDEPIGGCEREDGFTESVLELFRLCHSSLRYSVSNDVGGLIRQHLRRRESAVVDS